MCLFVVVFGHILLCRSSIDVCSWNVLPGSYVKKPYRIALCDVWNNVDEYIKIPRMQVSQLTSDHSLGLAYWEVTLCPGKIIHVLCQGNVQFIQVSWVLAQTYAIFIWQSVASPVILIFYLNNLNWLTCLGKVFFLRWPPICFWRDVTGVRRWCLLSLVFFYDRQSYSIWTLLDVHDSLSFCLMFTMATHLS